MRSAIVMPGHGPSRPPRRRRLFLAFFPCRTAASTMGSLIAGQHQRPEFMLDEFAKLPRERMPAVDGTALFRKCLGVIAPGNAVEGDA